MARGRRAAVRRWGACAGRPRNPALRALRQLRCGVRAAVERAFPNAARQPHGRAPVGRPLGALCGDVARAGALVHAIDLSVAVDANRRNIGERANYAVAQADVRALPFPAGVFDVVLCLGVLQHTPSPEQSIAALWRMVAPGGQLVIDHYTWTLSQLTKLAPLYRLILKRQPPTRAKQITDALVDVFFPLHWAVRRVRPLQMLLSRVSPCLANCHV